MGLRWPNDLTVPRLCRDDHGSHVSSPSAGGRKRATVTGLDLTVSRRARAQAAPSRRPPGGLPARAGPQPRRPGAGHGPARGRDVTPLSIRWRTGLRIRVIKEPTDVPAACTPGTAISATCRSTRLHTSTLGMFRTMLQPVWSTFLAGDEALPGGLRGSRAALCALAGMAYGIERVAGPVRNFSSMAIARPGGTRTRHIRPDDPVTGRCALRQPAHHPPRGVDQGGSPLSATCRLSQRELHVPPAVVREDARHLGQPLHDAQRAPTTTRGCAARCTGRAW